MYGGMSAEEKPQQLLRAEFRLAETSCAGPRKAANYLVRLGELWTLFTSLGEPKTDNAKKAALIRGIRGSLPGIFQQLVAQPQLDYAGLSRVLVSATSYMDEGIEGPEHALGMHVTTTCRYCGKAGHTARECWTAHPELKPTKRSRVRCFTCQKTGHLKRDCPEVASRKNKDNVENVSEYPKHRRQRRKHPIVDSGSTLHLTSDKGKLAFPARAAQGALIKQADGTTLKAIHKGNVTLTHETGKTLTLEDVLHVPELSEDLISVRALNERGYSVNFMPNGGAITKGGQRWDLVRGGGAWVLPEAQDTAALVAHSTPTGSRNRPPAISWQLLHERLGHASERKLRALETARLVKLSGECGIDKCEPCLLCKPRRTNIPRMTTHSGEVVVQADGMPWKGGYKGQSGAITFSHRINKVVHVYPYCHKSEAVKIIDDYLTRQLPRLRPRATCVQTDAGTEFLSREWVERCRRAGLNSRHAPPSCQAMNGQVEKDQATLAGSARAMLRGRNVPDKYWPPALQTAAFLKNRTTPWEEDCT